MVQLMDSGVPLLAYNDFWMEVGIGDENMMSL